MSMFVNVVYMQLYTVIYTLKSQLGALQRSPQQMVYNYSKSKKFPFQSHFVCHQQNWYYRTHAVWLRVFLFLKNPAIEMLYLLAWQHAGWGQFLRPFSPWKTTRYHPLWIHLKNTCLYSLSRHLQNNCVWKKLSRTILLFFQVLP